MSIESRSYSAVPEESTPFAALPTKGCTCFKEHLHHSRLCVSFEVLSETAIRVCKSPLRVSCLNFVQKRPRYISYDGM